MNSININRLSGDILFTIDKTKSIRDQLLDKLGTQQYTADVLCPNFIPWLHKLVFLKEGDTNQYSMNELKRLNTDSVTMIYIPMTSTETFLFREILRKEFIEYHPSFEIILKYHNCLYSMDLLDFTDTDVKYSLEFQQYEARNTIHVRYILDDTDIELNRYQCAYIACKSKLSLPEKPILFHVKFCVGPDPNEKKK